MKKVRKMGYGYSSVGVIALVAPWNNPLAIPLGKIAPALLYGNMIVWKPALAASSVAIRLMSLLQLAGCQPGVVNLVSGNRSTAEALMLDEHVDAVTLTGSLSAGYSAQDISTRRHIPLQAELGGNNGAIIWSDCELEETAFKVAEAAFGMAGQRCTANRRVIVESRCYDIFLKYFETAVATLTWGDPIDDKTQIGPLISQNVCQHVDAIVSRAKTGANAIILPHKLGYTKLIRMGAYYPPTIICCSDHKQEIVQEESFGPVMVVQRASNWDSAMQFLNGYQTRACCSTFFSIKDVTGKIFG